MATIQISSKDLKDLLGNYPKAERDWQLERLEDVKTLTDIILEYRLLRARPDEIASAIIRFVKKGSTGG